MTHQPGPGRPSPRADIVQMLGRLQIPVTDPDLNGWQVAADFSPHCVLRIDDERNGDPRDRQYQGICMNFGAVALSEPDRRAYMMTLGEAMKFAGLPDRVPADFPNLRVCEGILAKLREPLERRLAEFDRLGAPALLQALKDNRFKK